MSPLPFVWFLSPILPPVRRGILGGTFDPPHIGHLLAGEIAYHQLGLDEVRFIPAGSPWQKSDRAVSDPHHRWAMTQRAVAGVGYFVADEREIERSGWTYTADTLAEFAPSDDLILILGSDAAAGLDTWNRADEVRERAQIAVAPRGAVDASAVEAAAGPNMTWLDMPRVDVSGTEIRQRMSDGRSIRFMVREAVWGYLVEHGLYG